MISVSWQFFGGQRDQTSSEAHHEEKYIGLNQSYMDLFGAIIDP